MSSALRRTAVTPLALENLGVTGPRAVLLGDSFNHNLIPFLSERCRRLVVVPTCALDTTAIEQEKPDVVIHEMAERFLTQKPPEDPPEVQSAD